MKKNILFRVVVSIAILLLTTLSLNSYATHLFGADLYYTHIAGNTYKVTLVLYGDCSGNSFPLLTSSQPEIEIRNNNFLYQTITLSKDFANSDVEVTPVCPSQINNTTCVGGTVPGIMKFTFTGNVTLNTTSANWSFHFDGTLGAGHTAGRSNAITNIVSGSTLTLEATLNNTLAPNSAPEYTTIPTPFFCINKPVQYNQGAIDPNNDNLTFSLTSGLTPAGNVNYIFPFTAGAPLAAAAGSFVFNGTNGQLSFTPNQVQSSLVVNKVEEYRNGVLVGTSMREMIFVVLNNCNNNPPGGNITNVSGGTQQSGTTVNICGGSNITFSINPTDLDFDNITMSVTGLPPGSTFNIAGNGTASPIGTFSWSVPGSASGPYNFFITYTDNGCPLSSKQTVAYTINVVPQPNFNFQLISPATCTKKAVFTLTPSGGPAPWTVIAKQGVTTVLTINNIIGSKTDSLAPGTYTFTITGSNNCTKDTTITIVQPSPIVPQVSLITPTCYGGNDGTIAVLGSNGTPPYQYALGAGPFSANNVFNNLAAGTYTLHIKDAAGCLKDTTVVLPDPPRLDANIFLKKPPCNFFQSGEIVVNAFNGTAPYQYALGAGPFSANNTFTGLASGSYTLHIIDANNCTRDTVIALPDSIHVHANAIVTNVLCNGGNTGSITMNAFGATAPYTYSISAGPQSANNIFPNLTAGIYNFHIEDANNCYLDTAVNVTEPPVITTSSVVTDVLCNGNNTGSVTITPQGGVPPYTYAIGAGAYGPANTFNGLTAGNYTLHVKDANNCIKDTIITVSEPTPITFANIAEVQPLCYGTATGSYTITAAGGVPPYTYAINAGVFGVSNSFTNLPAGTYTLRIRDANNCDKDTTLTLLQPDSISIIASVAQSTCSPLNNGSVTFTATGGTPSYQYAVGAGPYSPNNTLSPLAAGTYTFHIKDANNCIKDTTITITDSLEVFATVSITDALCFNEPSGIIDVTSATGGVSPYTYALNGGAYSPNTTISNVLAGAHVLHIKDDIGCIKDTNVQVNQPSQLFANAFITTPSCFGFSDGNVLFAPSGGTPPYEFAMGAGPYSAVASFSNLAKGTYTFHIKDANNCIKDTTFNIDEPTQLFIAYLKITPLRCFGDSSGIVTIVGDNGTPPYTYSANNGPAQVNTNLTGLHAGVNTVTVTDSRNCVVDSVVNVPQPPKLVFDSSFVVSPTCEGFPDGAVSLFAAGGISPYEYKMNNGTYSAKNTFKELTEGQYTFFVKDSNLCEHDTTITLIGFPHIVVTNVNVTDVRCYGLEDGEISLTVAGGVQPLKYRINNGPLQAASIFDSLKAAQHIVTIVDNEGCKKDTAITVGTPDPLAVITIVTPNDCEGYDDGGSILAEVEGGIPPYDYLWSTTPAQTLREIYNLPNGKYRVWVKDANACTDSSDASILYSNCCKVFIPDAFTPNNDGKNDKIHVMYKGDLEIQDFSIYNRFGQRVFSTKYASEGWDGTFNGKPAELGVYMYYMKAVCGNSGTEIVEYKGDITLIR